MQEELVSLFRGGLLVCEGQGLFGGPHFALDGLQRPSHAAKAWSGTFDDLREQKAQVEAKVQSLLEAHARADQEGAAVSMPESRAAPDKVREQIARWEKQAARIENCLAPSEPKRGTRGKALQSQVTDQDSAKLQTAHGGIQGDNGQARVDSTPQVIVHAEAFGNGQDSGHVAPMIEGAKATVQALGLSADYVEGKRFSADSNYHSEGNLEQGAGAKLDAYIPAPHVRAREPRFATQGRHTPPTAEAFTRAALTDDKEHDRYTCPSGKVWKLEARRHKIGTDLYRRDEAEEVDCHACPRREKGLRHAETRCKHLAVYVEAANATLSQQMIAKIDTPEARKIYGQRLAIVEPGVGNIRTQKRWERLTLRGKITVTIQWRLYCIVHTIDKLVHGGMAA